MLILHSVFFDDMHPNWRIEESSAQHDILILVVRGSLSYYLNGNAIPLTKGDFLYIPQGTIRSGINDPSGPHQKYSAHFRINRPEQFPLTDPYAIHKIRTRSLDYLKQRFSALAQQWFGRLPHFETICNGISLELLGHMAREGKMKQFSSAKLLLVSEVQEYIISHFRQPVSIGVLAQLLKRSPNYITQTYKEVTGFTPITYMHHVRIQAACNLITTTSMTIGQVSDYLGYNDQSHFNRVFKKIMSYPPSAMLHEIGIIKRLPQL